MGEPADAVRAHFAQALARRMETAPEAVQRVLQGKLTKALAHGVASEPPESPSPRSPKKPRSPLAELNLRVGASTRSELRSVRAFSETWSRICAEEDVAQAVQRGPENAGPLNSHMLVLRTLSSLRELSPDYLRRFMAHADTLLWLDRAGSRLKPPAGKGKAGRQKK